MSLALGPSTGLRLSPLLLTVRHTPSACVHPSTGPHLVCCGVQGRAQDWEGQLTGKLPATCLTGSPYGPHLWGENSGEVDSQHLPPALPTLPAEAPFSRRTAAKGPATLPLLPHLPSFVLLDTYAPFSCGWLSALPAKSFTLFVFRF